MRQVVPGASGGALYFTSDISKSSGTPALQKECHGLLQPGKVMNLLHLAWLKKIQHTFQGHKNGNEVIDDQEPVIFLKNLTPRSLAKVSVRNSHMIHLENQAINQATVRIPAETRMVTWSILNSTLSSLLLQMAYVTEPPSHPLVTIP